MRNRVYLFCLVILFVTSAFSEEYNNKLGVGQALMGNKKCLEFFDFYEFGVSSEIYVKPYKKEDDKLNYLEKLKSQNKKNQIASVVNEDVLKIVASKLIEIGNISPEFSYQIYNLIVKNKYRIAEPEEFHLLERSELLGASPISYSKLPLTSIALRNAKDLHLRGVTTSIGLHRDLLPKLCSLEHVAGLILHTAFFEYMLTTARSDWFYTSLTNKRAKEVSQLDPLRGASGGQWDRGSGARKFLTHEDEQISYQKSLLQTTEVRLLTAKVFSKYFESMTFNQFKDLMLMLSFEIHESPSPQYPNDETPKYQTKFYYGWNKVPTYREFNKSFLGGLEYFSTTHENYIPKDQFRMYGQD